MTEVAVAPVLPASVHARRALIFALIPFGFNLIANIATRILDPMILSAPRGQESAVLVASAIELWIIVLTRLLVAASLVLAFINARAALAETRDGTVSGRGRAKAAIVVASILSALWVVSVIVLIGQVIGGFVVGMNSPY